MPMIRIKGVKEPIMVSLHQAMQIKNFWLDPKIPDDYIFAFKDIQHCFIKSEIKSIFFEKKQTEQERKNFDIPHPDYKASSKALKETRNYLIKEGIIKN